MRFNQLPGATEHHSTCKDIASEAVWKHENHGLDSWATVRLVSQKGESRPGREIAKK